MQIAWIKQAIEKVFNKEASLAERICILFHGQGIEILLIITARLLTISIIVLTIAGALGSLRSSYFYIISFIK